MKIKFLTFFKSIFYKNKPTVIDQKTLEDGVAVSVKKYHKTLDYLEKYDRGEISETENVVGHKSLQEYLQHLQNNNNQPTW
jgi:hypothetical protein